MTEIKTEIPAADLWAYTHRRISIAEKEWEHGESLLANGWEDAPLLLTVRPGKVTLLNDGHRRVSYLVARERGNTPIPTVVRICH